jgi:hypothetical protein
MAATQADRDLALLVAARRPAQRDDLSTLRGLE